MKLFKSVFLIAFLLPIFIGIGCSDNGSGSNDEIPANLVDTWWYQSGTMNGEPLEDPYMIGHEADSVAALSMSFRADGTWDGKGYRLDMTLISTVSGTFTVSGNMLNLRLTARDGEPVDPVEEQTWPFLVSGDILTFTMTDTDPYIGEFTVVLVFNRE